MYVCMYVCMYVYIYTYIYIYIYIYIRERASSAPAGATPASRCEVAHLRCFL